MAEMELLVGGHRYLISCADGEEESLRQLGAMVDDQIASARLMAGGLTETRQLLFAAILLADRLTTAQNGDATAPHTGMKTSDGGNPAPAIELLADRIEAVTARLQRLVE